MRYEKDVNEGTLIDVAFVLLEGAMEIAGMLLKAAFILLGELLKGIWLLLVFLYHEALAPLTRWLYRVTIASGTIWLYKAIKYFQSVRNEVFGQ